MARNTVADELKDACGHIQEQAVPTGPNPATAVVWTMGYLYALLDARAVGLRRAMSLYERCSAVLGPGPPQRRCNSFKVPFSC